MEYKELGNTGIRLSKIGFGAATLGNEYGQLIDGQGAAALHLAKEHGINWVDTSPYYGRGLSESRLGRFLKGQRKDWVLATKVGRYDVDGFNFSSKFIKASFERSLERLQTDYLDIFQLHDIEFVEQSIIREEAIPTLLELKKEGKVRAIGVTGYPLVCLQRILCDFSLDCTLSYCHYNLLHDGLRFELFPLANEKGFGIINASVLHMGMLSKKGAPNWHMAPDHVKSKVNELMDWCTSEGVAIEKLAIQFASAPNEITSTLIGLSSETEVLEALQSIEEPMDKELLVRVQELLRPVQNSSWETGLPENNS